MNSERKERFKANKKARKAAAREAARVAMLVLVRAKEARDWAAKGHAPITKGLK